MTTAGAVLLLTLLLGIQPVTTDLHLPALPTLQHELGASIAAAHATVYPLTLGIGAFSVAVAAVAWTLVQRHGEPVPATLVLAETRAA